MNSYILELTKRTLKDVKADQRTYRIAKAIFRTNPIAALKYAEGYNYRIHCEKPIIPVYDRDV